MNNFDVTAATTDDLSAVVLQAIHDLMLVAFDGDFPDEDWEHTIGGTHFFVTEEAEVVSHASVVPRHLHADGSSFRTGYVEGVATHPDHRHRGLGLAVVTAATDHVRSEYELGGLGTDLFSFYARAGWERWRGKTFARTSRGLIHTADEDGYVMVLRFGASATLDLDSEISCEERNGDDW